MRTLAILAILPAAPAGQAAAGQDVVRIFASCAGRFSAQMEHEWLLSDPAADRTGAERDRMIGLLETLTAPGVGRALDLRIEAKQAQTALLTRATFNRDRGDAHWARQRAETEIAACRSLLLG